MAAADVIYLSGVVRPELLGLREDLGVMLTPNMGNRPNLRQTWHAHDTGLYDPKGARPFVWDTYKAHLEALSAFRHRCLFATAPDTYGDGRETWERARDVLPLIRQVGYRAALVAQPGIEDVLEWDAFDCLFVGGPNDWHRSDTVAALVAEAQRRGKWCHRGRVNSGQRLRMSRLMGFDSADGTFLRRAPDENAPRMQRWLDKESAQPALLEIA